ncbi:lysM and putative peptidoglycan-binding domain-containing protein 1 [Solea solea]|uniref:lysM and putative peptidoglycan-binding domain-containing protein 1 n=1 Tax=Solea solea TaxID=90069 RepID=UPI00272D9443|nr:lysM and putative peptidoglycan-binding domain-containing protein 1 [Solea solea]
MSGRGAPLPVDGNGLLRGSRTRSYGSLVRSPVSPAQQRRIEHKLQPGETLQGLALKYGVTMEQIKRANRLYTNDSIFLKKSLSIPVLSDLDHCNNGADLAQEDSGGGDTGRAPAQNGHTGSSSEKKLYSGEESAGDITPESFLKRMDELINWSKQAAVKGYQDAEKRVAALEAACTSGTSDQQPFTRSHSVTSFSKMQQQEATYVAVPRTITKLTRKLRDREDEIFEL